MPPCRRRRPTRQASTSSCSTASSSGPGLAALPTGAEPYDVSVANASSSTLLKSFAEQYADAIATTDLLAAVTAGEAVSPVAVEDLVLHVANKAARQYASLAASWTALQERVADSGSLSFAGGVRPPVRAGLRGAHPRPRRRRGRTSSRPRARRKPAGRTRPSRRWSTNSPMKPPAAPNPTRSDSAPWPLRRRSSLD